MAAFRQPPSPATKHPTPGVTTESSGSEGLWPGCWALSWPPDAGQSCELKQQWCFVGHSQSCAFRQSQIRILAPPTKDSSSLLCKNGNFNGTCLIALSLSSAQPIAGAQEVTAMITCLLEQRCRCMHGPAHFQLRKKCETSRNGWIGKEAVGLEP